MANLKNINVEGTGSVVLPSGTIAQRPTSPQNGYTRFNTDLSYVELYNDGNWITLDKIPSASAISGHAYSSNIVDNNVPYELYVFQSSGGSITIDQAGEIEYLILAGGGGGEQHWAGGGGAGGLIQGKSIVSPGTYSITVGSGGAGGTSDNNDTAEQGGNSSVFGLTAIGGGPGAGDQSDESPIETFAGGSGGGAGDDAGRSGGAALQPDSASGGIGHPGGFVDNVNSKEAAGGGGAGEPGGDKVGNTAGAGGKGVLTSFLGYPLWIAGGGGGAQYNTDPEGGYGGLGGGGLGGRDYPEAGFPGADYLGSGGGGGTYTRNGGSGGNGLVAIRYRRRTGNLITPAPVNDNLVLHVDAADTSSYWNGHRTRKNNWYDTVGNNAGAFINDPGFTGDRGGAIQFDTTNYIDYGADLFDRPGGNFTLESWVRYNTVAGSYNNTTAPANFFGSETISYNSWYWGVLDEKLALWNKSAGGWNYGSTVLQPNTWYHVALVAYPQGTRYQFYVNGEAESGTHTTENWTASDAGIRIRYIAQGSSGNVRRPDGDFAIMRVYFRALGPLEMRQNFEAYRGRFGI